ncbi:MAG: hypothetical protein NVSMB1_00120 [Polyangiales bacterium]
MEGPRRSSTHSDPPKAESRLKELEGQCEHLSGEVLRLRTQEIKLYKNKELLDKQQKLYKQLYELGKNLNSTFNVEKILGFITQSVLYDFNFERCCVLVRGANGIYVAKAWEGYYDDEAENLVRGARVLPDSHLIERLAIKGQLLCPTECVDDELNRFGRETFAISEYVLSPLGNDPKMPLGLIIIGNSLEHAKNYQRITEHADVLIGVANLVTQISASMANASFYETLQTERDSLEQNVKDRTRALADALADLRELDNAKSNFFANVSHELRTPLTLSIGPLEQILQRETGLSPQDTKRHLDIVYRNQLRLLKLINNLLDFAKIDAGQMSGRFQECDLVEALRFYMGTVSAAAEARKIVLKMEVDAEPVKGFFDRDKIEKIVMNLLSNAFKFTPDGGAITIFVRSAGERIELSVTDTGIGIPAEGISKLFQRFAQVDNSAKRRYEGTGIGLAMIKEYVAIHGGTVSVESTVGVGSTFRVSIPKGSAHLPKDAIISTDESGVNSVSAYQLADFRTETDQEDRESSDDLGPRPVIEASTDQSVALAGEAFVASDKDAATDGSTVLVIDDVPDMRKFVAQVLRERYRVRTARDGLEGLNLARAIEPDLIVSDVMMPNMTGYELTREIRTTNGPLARTPIILLSAKGDLVGKLAGLEHGADDYLVKPFNADELLSRARNLLRLRRQERELVALQTRVIESERQTLRAEIEVARKVQANILPNQPSYKDESRSLQGFLMSATACSGDFWMYRKLPEGRLFVAIADVTGHGVGSAMVTELTYGALNALLCEGAPKSPSQVISAVNTIFHLGSSESPVWMTMVVAIVEADGRRLTLSTAGHPPVFCQRGGTRPTLLQTRSVPLGSDRNATYSDVTVDASSETRLLMYSDGLVEATDPKGMQFGLKRLGKVFSSADGSPAACLESLRSEFSAFTASQPLEDDVTAVALTLSPR